MTMQQQIRDIQDAAINQGWRIKRIPWIAPGKFEAVYNTPLTLVMGLGGAACFLGAVGGLLLRSGDTSPVVFFALAAFGVVSMALSRLVAAWQQRRRWVEVRGKRLDTEIRLGKIYNGHQPINSWEFRLVCSFEFQGKEYTVTPETPHLTVYKSQQAVEAFLAEKIDAEDGCKLWIDPKNPLHTCFDTKPRI